MKATMPKQTKKIKNRPLNSYNLFFILERQLLLQSKGFDTTKGKGLSRRSRSVYFDDYADLALQFPPLPSRYQSVHLSADWYMHGKDKKTREHIKTHGVISLKELSRSMAANWKMVDEDIKEYVTEVARMILDRRDELQYASLLRSYEPNADTLVAEEFPFDFGSPSSSSSAFHFGELCQVISEPSPSVAPSYNYNFSRMNSSIPSVSSSSASTYSIREVDMPDNRVIKMW
ncbi:predicted protein [Thalassiosira pseudonana CCMP1335]|uniref:HMG box domain-containing protein n=1 Tax=Thalassiosira pseudonana TaxID=35128 RepID=B8LC91_THAPS|nr:predicted protein [Thalassiosira pseudonana CCMP1335]EED87053.1 predicted protein [Thalassiosira pseudonana CCMP1335]|eukprot:scaffold1771_cov211-Alexandrium_tamarense.AAC.9